MHEHEQAEPSREADREERPQIYVASLADYNHGALHGTWVDADEGLETLHNAVRTMLATSPLARRGEMVEEWAIHDASGFGPWKVDEYESLETIAHVAEGIRQHGIAFAAWADHAGTKRDVLAQFEDAYRGDWESVQAYAEELLEDIGATDILEQVPDWLRPYVALDIESFARDMELGGDIWSYEEADRVHIFDGTI